MRIGIDGSCLSNRRGFGRFTRQLLDALSRQPTEHEFTVFVDRPSSGDSVDSRSLRARDRPGARSAQPGRTLAGPPALAAT